jgi:hypothetical protein
MWFAIVQRVQCAGEDCIGLVHLRGDLRHQYSGFRQGGIIFLVHHIVLSLGGYRRCSPVNHDESFVLFGSFAGKYFWLASGPAMIFAHVYKTQIVDRRVLDIAAPIAPGPERIRLGLKEPSESFPRM